jgi:hypothetical protein
LQQWDITKRLGGKIAQVVEINDDMKNEKNLGVSGQVWHASCYKQWRVCKEKGSNKKESSNKTNRN